MKPGTADEALREAWQELGYAEKPVNKTKYGKAFGMDGAQWCGLFVMWVLKQVNVYCPNTAYTPNGVEAFKARGAWFTKGKPKPGDLVYFDFPDDKLDRVSHVGICVKRLRDGRILCIEGNTTGNVLKKKDERNGGEVAVKARYRQHIVGWARPKYAPARTPIARAIEKAWRSGKI